MVLTTSHRTKEQRRSNYEFGPDVPSPGPLIHHHIKPQRNGLSVPALIRIVLIAETQLSLKASFPHHVTIMTNRPAPLDSASLSRTAAKTNVNITELVVFLGRHKDHIFHFDHARGESAVPGRVEVNYIVHGMR